jgi:hypothetical protein
LGVFLVLEVFELLKNYSQPVSFHEALSLFEHIEHDLELPSWQINGVYVWKLIRFRVFVQFRIDLGQITEAHPEMKRKRKTKVERTLEFARSLIKQNPFLSCHRASDRIIIPHTRKRWLSDRFLDPISARAWLREDETASLVLDRTSSLDPVFLPGAPHYDVMAVLGRIAGQFVRVRFHQNDIIRMRAIQQLLNTDLTFDGRSLEHYVFNVVRNFIGLRAVFRSLYQKVKPKALYVVVGYGLEAPIAAAQELGIPVAEFQHGSMDRGHLAYDYRGWEHVPYFADYLLTWGEAWHPDTALPTDCVLHPVGAPHIELGMRQVAQTSVRFQKRVLVLSQGPVARDLIEAVIQFSLLRPDWDVVVRPHPSESASSLSAQLQEFDRVVDGRIHVDDESSLAQACGKASVVFGASSTALVESLLVGCKMVMLRSATLPPRFQPLLDAGDALAVQSGKELADCIDVLPQGSARRYFAEPVEDVCALVEN